MVRLRSIGDIVLLTPALRLLKEWRPDLRISVVVEPRFRELLEDNPDVEEILDPGTGRGWKKTQARLAAAGAIRQRKFLLCVNLHGGPTSAFLTRWSGAPCKVGFHHYRSRRTYQVLIPDAKVFLGQTTIHTAELQAAAFFYLGLPCRDVPRARLFVQPQHQAWWEKKRTSMGILANQGYALVHPTALYATKQWAPENFARAGDYLQWEKGVLPIYSCGPGESAVLDAIEKSSGSAIHRFERAGLGEFAAALTGARIFVGNDSGPAHMARALGLPTVVIFGSSSSLIWGPWPRPEESDEGRGEHTGGAARVVQNFYDCNPCPGDRCYRYERPECILSIKFEQVQAAIEAVLKKDSQQSRVSL